MIVVDSSVLAPALVDSDPDGAGLRAQLAGHELVAPQILDLEVLSVYRRHARSGEDHRLEGGSRRTASRPAAA